MTPKVHSLQRGVTHEVKLVFVFCGKQGRFDLRGGKLMDVNGGKGMGKLQKRCENQWLFLVENQSIYHLLWEPETSIVFHTFFC